MSWTAKWNNNTYKLIDSLDIQKSSREVTFSDITIDFNNKTIEDLPYMQQEIKIYDNNNNLRFTGFVSDYKLPELNRMKIEEDNQLEISLYSPRQMTTKRVTTIIKTCLLEDAIKEVIEILYADGFILKEINVPKTTITIKLISRTIEEILNYFSNKYSLYWNIDENKNITINSIEYQFNKPSKKSLDINNYKEEINGFINITPNVENMDYANIINVKNARIFYSDNFEDLDITLKQNDRIDFENPLDISLATAQRVASNVVDLGATQVINNIIITYNNNQTASIISAFNVNSPELKNGINIKDIATDDKGGVKFVLTMDQTFKNLATSLTYKGEGTVTINSIQSDTFLRYASMKLINWAEINKYKGIITPSGQIEKVLDVESGWFTVNELIDYVRSTFVNNNKYTNEITLTYDEENDITIGDKITFNLPEYFTVGDFVITDLSETIDGNEPTEYELKLRNTNLTENYLDLFRNSTDIEEQESQTEVNYVVEYAEEETIREIHEVEIMPANYDVEEVEDEN